MALFTGVQHLCIQYNRPLIYHFWQMFVTRRTPSARPFFIFHVDRSITRIQYIHLLYCTWSFAVVHSLWRRVRNSMDSGEIDDTWWFRTPPFLMAMQGVTALLSRTFCAMAMGDSGTSTLLTRYESMRLRSLGQSERTTARNAIQHERWTYPCYRAVSKEHQRAVGLRLLPNIWKGW